MAPNSPGTVTFLLTDIEGSTRLLSRVGQRYPVMVEHHRTVIAEAATRHGGRAVPMEGDACLATFPSASGAVAAAIEAQRNLKQHDWGDAALGVRIGIHTDDAMLHHGEYFGLGLHRAARIADAAHGGQILVSGATGALVRDSDGAYELIDRGLHRLKDLEAPVHLFQVVAEGLAQRFPPLRTQSPDTHNLPATTTPLVGRGEELAAVAGLVRQQRLVTLTGPGGIGKTRLALGVAAEVSAAFADGVWFVELTRVRDPAAVPGLIAGALGVEVSGGPDPAAVVAEALRNRVALLVVDNFEHVIAAAPVVSAILAAAPQVHVLATSRERLLLTGEHVYDVPPLPLQAGGDRPHAPPDAVTLFLDRAQAQDASFEADAAILDDVAAICAFVDGLPLAIELAAAQVRLLSVQSIRDRLGEGLDALDSGLRDRPPRHRTLRDTIAWSYRLLPPDEQQLFARMSVFHGGRTLEAVRAVCTEPASDPYAGIAALVDKSLLHRRTGAGGGTTFEMLELIHEFASEVLHESGEAHTIRRRHATHFVDLAERADAAMFGFNAYVWEDVLDDQFGNLQAALEWAFGDGDAALGVRLTAALELYWYWRGDVGNARRWVAHAVRHADPADRHTLGRLSVARGFFGYADGDATVARKHWQQALQAFRATDDHSRLPLTLAMVALTYAGEEDHDHAFELVDEGLAIARADDDRSRITADVLNVKGEIARLAGDDPLAGACYRDALELVEPTGDERYVARIKANLAFVAGHEGDHPTALRLLLDALNLSWKHGRQIMVAWTLGELAAPELALGRPERAARLIGAAEAVLQRLGFARQLADQPEHDRTMSRLAAVLDPDRLSALLAEGAGMTLEDAVDHALRQP